ncbi:hypothetical protein Q3G72_007825 [Acer saccharum]|nr:hypothetical protein Q3G72_007825 [Acer saccharum]
MHQYNPNRKAHKCGKVLKNFFSYLGHFPIALGWCSGGWRSGSGWLRSGSSGGGGWLAVGDRRRWWWWSDSGGPATVDGDDGGGSGGGGPTVAVADRPVVVVR